MIDLIFTYWYWFYLFFSFSMTIAVLDRCNLQDYIASAIIGAFWPLFLTIKIFYKIMR